MASLNPAQYYSHLVQAVSGSDRAHDLMFTAAAASGQTIIRGACVTLDSTGKFINGKNSDHDMVMWVVNGTADFDYEADVGNISGGKLGAFVASGGYELFTTEYVAGTYHPNDPLTTATAGNVGKLTESTAAYSTVLQCGVVSKGVVADIYTTNVLYFWPVFVPATKTTP